MKLVEKMQKAVYITVTEQVFEQDFLNGRKLMRESEIIHDMSVKGSTHAKQILSDLSFELLEWGTPLVEYHIEDAESGELLGVLAVECDHVHDELKLVIKGVK